MAFTFVLGSMVHGYHEYMAVWENPVLGEELSCMREIGNPHDPTAVAIQKEIGGAIITICVHKERWHYKNVQIQPACSIISAMLLFAL